MVRRIQLGEITADVVSKDFKNIHLGVYPPNGRVRISAPSRMNLDTVRVFALSKLGWIKQQQAKFREQVRETPRENLDRESHYVWDKRYLLNLIKVDAPPRIELRRNEIVLQVRPGASDEVKQAVLAQWYRGQLRAAVSVLVANWEPILGVKVERVF